MQDKANNKLAALLAASVGLVLQGPVHAGNAPSLTENGSSNADNTKVELSSKEKKSKKSSKDSSSKASSKGKDASCKGKDASCKGKDASCKGADSK